MSRVAVITDTHFGVRNDSPSFYDYFKKFNEIFFKKIDNLGITKVFHLGDLFDRRKGVSFITAKRTREDFLEPLNERNIETHIIAGNHDVYYRNTNSVNALTEIVRGYKNINVYIEPTEVIVDNDKILLLPWITEDNYRRSIDAIKTSTASMVFGHLSINGFEQYKGQVRDGTELSDLNKSLFDRFSIVASGHFHHRSKVDNVHYLGAAYEFTWNDYNDARGFSILDMDKKKFTFIQNPYKKFHMISYDEKVDNDIDLEALSGTYVKVLVMDRSSQPQKFEEFLNRLSEVSPTDITLVEDMSQYTDTTEDYDDTTVEDTVSLMDSYIDGLQVNVDSARLKSTMKTIYNEAVILEEV